MGAWSVWEAIKPDDGPRGSRATSDVNVDISYSKAPNWIRALPESEYRDTYATFWALAALSFNYAREKSKVVPHESDILGVQMPPEDHVACFDYLYYVSTVMPFEFDADFSPIWREVLRYLRFTERMEDLAEAHVRRALEVADGIETPPWITVHVRRSDFDGQCPENSSLDDCFAPLSTYARHVETLKEKLMERDNREATHVIVTSDEKNPSWWEKVHALGWTHVNYRKERTVETLGPWYPTFIDAVVQAAGAGFVGTEGSTMSLIASRRVEDWGRGVTSSVQWGYPGADHSGET